MASITFVTRGINSVLNNCLELARRCVADGHDVVFLGVPSAQQTVEAHGFVFHPLHDPVPTEPSDDQGARSLVARWRARRKEDALPQLFEAIAATDPDLLVIEIEMHAVVIATAKLKVPTVLISPWCSVFRDNSSPPLHSTIQPQDPGAGRQSLTAWATDGWQRFWENEVVERFRPSAILERSAATIEHKSIDRRVLARLARRHRFGLWRNTSATQWLRPHVYSHVPIAATVPEAFDLGQRTPDNFHYVGPAIRPGEVDSQIADHDAATLEAAYQASERPGAYLVYFALGTRFGGLGQAVDRFFAAFAEDPNAVCLASLGRVVDPSDVVISDPSRMFVVDYSPQLTVLGRADVAIIHGGIGTIQQCIDQEVPMVVHQFGAVDQPGCAVRVAHHGLGRRMDLMSCSPQQLRQAADAVRSDSTIKNNLRSMAEASRRYQTDKVFEALVRSQL